MPVIEQPGVKNRFCEMIADVEVLKLLNYQVAVQLTKGLPVYAEGSTVKAYGSDLYQRVNNEIMEIMGPYGQLELKSIWAPLGGAMPNYFRRDLVLIFGGEAIEVQKNIIAMAEAILRDKRRIMPCAAFCTSEYGIGGYFVGVPCMLGRNGVEKVIEVELNAEERASLDSSVAHVKEIVALAETFLAG